MRKFQELTRRAERPIKPIVKKAKEIRVLVYNRVDAVKCQFCGEYYDPELGCNCQY